MFKNLDSQLNPEQYKAVTTINGPLLVLAGAGTGKTRVITFRIAYMISEGIPAKQILAVTFTNKAAKEMRERIGKLLPNKTAKPHISTFHSLGLHILRQDIQHLGYRPNFSIYDEADQQAMMKNIVHDVWPHLIDKIDIPAVKTAISKYKESFIDPKEAENKAATPVELVNATIYREYELRLKHFNAVDFDDLIILPLRLFSEHPVILEKFQDQFHYIMIDEFQDTNYPQFRFTQQIASKYNNICVVGDDDQSIYGWRGADYKNILEFDRHFPNTTVIKLEQNYRSTMSILEAANSVIKNNLMRRQKKLWSNKQNNKKLTLLTYATAREEAESVVQHIIDQKLRKNFAFKDFAILMRTAHQSRLFEEQLRKSRIAYAMIGGTRFFDRKEVKDIVSYLKLLMNPNDEVSLMRIINTPPRGIGLTTLAALNEYCKKNKSSLMDALKKAETLPELNKRSVIAIQEFLDIIAKYRSRVDDSSCNLAELLVEFIKDIKYEKEVARVSEDRDEISSRMVNVYDFIDDVRYFQSKDDNDKSLRNYLSSITLNPANDKNQEDEQKKDELTLITIHSCKGLEFPIVYLVGMEEGKFPHSRSIQENEGDISEERRLCYVGITRAKDELYLSYALGRNKYGDIEPAYPSRFLKEIPEHLIESDDLSVSEEDESKIAEFYLQKMKNIVNS
ncbi:MAG: UvrD-helicase domain-containing protein [Candidatus Auribacterota bacterium]